MPDQFTAEIGRNVQFVMTALTCDAGTLTDPEAGTFAQNLSRMINETTGAHIAFGHLERATIAINPMMEEVSAADSRNAHYEPWKMDWEVGLIGIRQVGAILPVGLPADTAGAGAVNPLTEIMLQAIGSGAGSPNRKVKLVIESVDRIWTFYGSLGPYRWDYSGPRGSDSLTLRPIDIGDPNPTYVAVSATGMLDEAREEARASRRRSKEGEE